MCRRIAAHQDPARFNALGTHAPIQQTRNLPRIKMESEAAIL
jgi:hypothetical protein